MAVHDLRPKALHPAAGFYRPELDALRFFAFLLVFCDHLLPGWVRPESLVDMGAFGVCIFFCLSAYLIVTLILKELDATGTVRVRAFAVRRILRIWPLYFLMIGLGYAYGFLRPNAHIGAKAVAALVLLAGNIYVGRNQWRALGAISALWSISVEEQFYLVVPVMTKLTAKNARPVLALICGAAIVSSYAAIVITSRLHPYAKPFVTYWTSSLVQFQFFAAGGLIAIWLYGREVRLAGVVRIGALGMAGALYWFAATRKLGIRGLRAQSTSHIVYGYALLLVATCVILIAVLNAPVRVPHAIRYLGKISYGLYVFHGPIIWQIQHGRLNHMHWEAALVSSSLTLLCAAVSYHYFERPILRLKQRFEVVRTRPA